MKSTIGCHQPLQEGRVVPPILNLPLKCLEFTAIQIEFQQSACHQMKQTWGLDWGPRGWFGDVHPHGCTRGTRCFHIETLSIFSQPGCHLTWTLHRRERGYMLPRSLHGRERRNRLHRRNSNTLGSRSRSQCEGCPFWRRATRLDGCNTDGVRRRSLVHTICSWWTLLSWRASLRERWLTLNTLVRSSGHRCWSPV